MHHDIRIQDARCTHDGCHIPATRIAECRCGGSLAHRGYSCGNHETDRPGLDAFQRKGLWMLERAFEVTP